VTIQSHVLSVVRSIQKEEPGRAGGVRIVPQARLRFNPTAESKNLFVPGLMAFVLTIISCLMTAITLTREKETGTMEALLVSPLRPWQIIVGKVAPYLLVGFASVVGVIAEARLVFDVPCAGAFLRGGHALHPRLPALRPSRPERPATVAGGYTARHHC
jgi:ABC-2 type transport system permease protein